MTYFLFLPIALYIVLATIIFRSQPRTVSSLVLALYLGAAAVTSCALLVLNTSAVQLTASVAASIAGILITWSQWLFLPLVLLGLYFEPCLHQRSRRDRTVALVTLLLISAAIDLVLYALLRTDGLRMAIWTEYGFWPGWWLARWNSPLIVTSTQLVALLPVAAVVGAAIWAGRIDLWRAGLPLLLASTASTLTPLLAPLTGEWAITLTGLSFALPVLVLARMVRHTSPELPLESLLQSMIDSHSDGALVIDDEQRVIWRDLQIGRWLGGSAPAIGLVPPPMTVFLTNPALREAVAALIRSGDAVGEFVLPDASDERTLVIERRPLQARAGLPGAQLIVVRDVTATRVRKDLHERRQEILALSAVSADIASALDMDEVIRRALAQVLAMAHLDAASVTLVDPLAPGGLRLGGSAGMRGIEEHTRRWLLNNDSLIATAIRTGELITVSDAAQDGALGQDLLGAGLRSGVTVPLIARDRAIGALHVGCAAPQSFEPLTIALIESVGRQLAVALENARLHGEERAQRHLAETLREVAGLLTTADLEDTLRQILGLLRRVLSFDSATLMLVSAPGELRVRAHTGLRDVDEAQLRMMRVAIDQYPYLQRLFAERQPQLVADTTGNPAWVTRPYAKGSWIGVPLVARGVQVLGCLSISHPQPGFFTERDLQLAAAFAGQAVVAVENHQLVAGEHRRRVQAEILQKASHDLVMSPNLDRAMSAALSNLMAVLQFDRAHIALLDSATHTWTPRASQPMLDKLPDQKTLRLADFPLVEQVVRTKRPHLVNETREEPAWQQARYSPQEIRGWMCLPLIVRDHVIGLLNVDSYTPHRFSQEQFQIAQVFANQIAAAIEIFRLLEATGRQNRTMRALNTILAASNEALTQENLMGVLLARVLETLNLTAGAIHRLDAQRGDLVLQVAAGLSPEAVSRLRRISPAAGQASLALPDDLGLALTSVPLVSHGSEIGVLSLCDLPGGPFGATFSHLLPQIGQQLGVVMDNANLFEDALRREALSTNLGRLSLAISAQLDRDTVLDLICRESMAVFEAHGAYIWLIEGNALVGMAAAGPAADWFAGHRINLDAVERLPVRVLRAWQAEVTHHVTDDTALDPEFLRMTQAKSAIAVPLLKADVPAGTLLLIHTDNDEAFAGWQTEQIGLLGVQAALALQNATLFDEIRHRLDQLRLVNEVGRYATAILSPQSLIEGVADKLSEILHYDLVGLMLIEDDDLSVHSIFVRDEVLRAADERSLRGAMQTAGSQAVRQAEPILQNQTHLRSPLSATPDPAPYCALATPLIAADEVIGVLIVQRRGFNSIVQEDLDVMEPLAAQLAISVANARLFEKVRQQTIELEGRVLERTAEIRRQQERTEAIIGSVADAVIVFDLDGQVMMMNPVARTLFDQHDLKMDLSKRISTLVTRALAQDGSGANLTEIIEAGAVALQVKAARVVDGERVLGSVAVLRDISQLKELDRLKDQFVSTVSHELRTPLTNLKLYLELMSQGRPERRKEYLQVMNRGVDRLEKLILDLLDLSRLQSEHRAEKPQRREPINLDDLIATVIQENVVLANSKHHTLRYEAEHAPLPWMLGDPDQIARALTNLLANAVNYTPEHGTVIVRSRTEGSEHNPAEWVTIEVSDTGIGIPEADLSHIFERFYRGANVNPDISGTGLGLAIIKEIAELHHGTITVESQPGAGSTFRLRLPAITSRVAGHHNRESSQR